jgi:hypothetical protein
MPDRSRKRPISQFADAIVVEALGNWLAHLDPDTTEKNSAAVESGGLGSFKGSKAGAEELSLDRLSHIALMTAQARCGKQQP